MTFSDAAPGPSPRVTAPSLLSNERLMGGLGGASLGVRFLTELSMYGSLGYWGASVSAPVPIRVALGVLIPLIAIAVWSRYLSPKASRRLADPAALFTGCAMFIAGTVGLAMSNHVALAATFEVIAVANALVVRMVGQRTRLQTPAFGIQ
jgi:hypothetical protein